MALQPLAALLLLLALAGRLAAGEAAASLPSVAICVAIKDQAVDVREWAIYHRAIGAQPATAALLPSKHATE
jgi:hypothetical protein